MENLRDKSIHFAKKLIDGEWKSPGLLEIQNKFSNFSDEEKKIILTCVIGSIDNCIHDFLFALQEQSNIKVFCHEKDIENMSVDLHGEIFTEEGWRNKFSQFGEKDSLI